jgi:hypothetical protein
MSLAARRREQTMPKRIQRRRTQVMERTERIELSSSVWKTEALPLS